MLRYTARYLPKIKWLLPTVGITGGVGGAVWYGRQRSGQLRNCGKKGLPSNGKKTDSNSKLKGSSANVRSK